VLVFTLLLLLLFFNFLSVQHGVDWPTRLLGFVTYAGTFAVLFSVSRPFFSSLVFTKGALCCVLGGLFSRVEPLDFAVANFYRS